MKKTFKFFAAALTIVAAASCAKEISNDNTQAPEQELVHKVFTASLNVDPETKTTLHKDGVTVHWTEDDVIKVIPAASKSGSDFNVVSIHEDFAYFAGETIDANSHRAVYPAAALLSDGHINWWYTEEDYFIFGSKASKTALAHQYAVENNFSIVEEFGVSSNFALSTSAEEGHLYFKNINAYLKVKLAMDDAASIEVSAAKVMSQPANGNQSLSEYAKLGGPLMYDLARGINGVLASAGEDITFKKQDGTLLLSGDDIYYYIAVPAVKIENLKLVVKDASGKVLQTLTKSGEFTFKANTIYNLGEIEAAPAAEPAKVGDYFYSDGTYSTELDSNKDIVGVVFYVGDPTEEDAVLKRDYPYCTNGLVVGLKRSSVQWLSENRAVYEWAVNNGYHTLQQFTYNFGVKENNNAKYKWGYNNTSAIREYASLNELTSGLVSFADSYSVAVEGASSWYIPSIAEMQLVRSAGIKSKVQSVGGDSLSGTYYYTSSEEDSSSYIPTITFESGPLYDGGSKRTYENVFAIFAF